MKNVQNYKKTLFVLSIALNALLVFFFIIQVASRPVSVQDAFGVALKGVRIQCEEDQKANKDLNCRSIELFHIEHFDPFNRDGDIAWSFSFTAVGHGDYVWQKNIYISPNGNMVYRQ